MEAGAGTVRTSGAHLGAAAGNLLSAQPWGTAGAFGIAASSG